MPTLSYSNFKANIVPSFKMDYKQNANSLRVCLVEWDETLFKQ